MQALAATLRVGYVMSGKEAKYSCKIGTINEIRPVLIIRTTNQLFCDCIKLRVMELQTISQFGAKKKLKNNVQPIKACMSNCYPATIGLLKDLNTKTYIGYFTNQTYKQKNLNVLRGPLSKHRRPVCMF